MSVLEGIIVCAGAGGLAALIVSGAVAIQRAYVPKSWGRALIASLSMFIGVAVVDVVHRVEAITSNPADERAHADIERSRSSAVAAAVVEGTETLPGGGDRSPARATSPSSSSPQSDPCVSLRRVKQAWSMATTLRAKALRSRSKVFVRRIERCRSKRKRARTRRVARSGAAGRASHSIASGRGRYRGLERFLADLAS